MQDRSPPARRNPLANARPDHTLGHVWTAPWQELSDASAALVGCGHVFRPVDAAGMAAGPNALRGSGPKQKRAL